MKNNGITTEYIGVTNEDLRLRRDPAWYVCDPSHHEHVATTTKGDREVRVFREGEMRIHIWDSREARDAGEQPYIIRYTDRLVGMNIETDEQLADAHNDDRLEWHMNAWFDLYAYKVGESEPTWLDCVQHDLPTAINEANEALSLDDIWEGA